VPVRGPGFEIIDLPRCDWAGPGIPRHKGDQNRTNQNVEKMNSGEHKVAHEEVIGVQRDSSVNFGAVFKEFYDAEADTTENR